MIGPGKMFDAFADSVRRLSAQVGMPGCMKKPVPLKQCWNAAVSAEDTDCLQDILANNKREVIHRELGLPLDESPLREALKVIKSLPPPLCQAIKSYPSY